VSGEKKEESKRDEMAKIVGHYFPGQRPAIFAISSGEEGPQCPNRGCSTNKRSESMTTSGSKDEKSEKKAEESSREAIGASAAHTGHWGKF